MTDLNNILKPIADAINDVLTAATARAEAAEKREAEFRLKMAELLGITPVNDNDAPLQSNQAEKPALRAIKRYSDAIFLEALTTEFQTATQLHVALASHGVSLASVYHRYRRLASAPSSDVEQLNNSFRLATPTTADDEERAPKREKTAASAARKVRAKKVVIKAANDDHSNVPKLINGCGLEMMRGLPDRSVDLVLADLPYGSTGLGIDPVIDVAEWMAEMQRIVTDQGSVVAFGSLKFAHTLMAAGLSDFKDRLIWHKPKGTGHQLLRHIQAHEDILVFSRGSVRRNAKVQMIFNPQGVVQKLATARRDPFSHLASKPRAGWAGSEYVSNTNWPRTVLNFGKDSDAMGLHPFAKPVALLEYLIRTYSNENALVLDPTMGSGSTGVAAQNTGRRFIGAENGTDKHGRCIYSIAVKRIAA